MARQRSTSGRQVGSSGGSGVVGTSRGEPGAGAEGEREAEGGAGAGGVPLTTTSEIKHNAWFGGVLISLGFNLSQQPPKSSTMLGFGGFQPPWASTSLNNPQN